MTELRSGVSTFLLTDVEGSTRLWEDHPDVMGDVMRRHDEIIQTVVEAHNGTNVRPRGEGDSTFSVFPDPAHAVKAITEIHIALAAEVWPFDRWFRIRAAVHTGEAQLRDGEFYGSTINRCARLRGIAHGGQTVVSQMAHQLAAELTPAPVSFRDLGTHRLKDFVDPERVWQVCHPSLPADFPALNSLDVATNNLPAALTSFVGRETEIADVRAILDEARLLTLTGVGGIGKTRLAIETARTVVGAYTDGVWLCELGALSDPELVPATLAGVLQLTHAPSVEDVDALVAYLRGRAVLLVVDTCEHVIDACAKVAYRLLRDCPTVRILATSRESLRVEGEHTFEVGPLGGGDGTAARRLFVDRARPQPIVRTQRRRRARRTDLCTCRCDPTRDRARGGEDKDPVRPGDRRSARTDAGRPRHRDALGPPATSDPRCVHRMVARSVDGTRAHAVPSLGRVPGRPRRRDAGRRLRGISARSVRRGGTRDGTRRQVAPHRRS